MRGQISSAYTIGKIMLYSWLVRGRQKFVTCSLEVKHADLFRAKASGAYAAAKKSEVQANFALSSW